MTNEEIIKGIKLCNGYQYCDKCPFANVKPKKNRTCCEQLMLEAGRLIAKQEEELAALRERLPVWIPVTEQLPNLRDTYWRRVVIACDQGDVIPLVYERSIVRGKTVGRWEWMWGRIYDEPESITHWMPLPEPPKEVENDD